MFEYNFKFTRDRPIYLQLVEQIKLYIISGQIPPGTKLPPIREFSLQAKVNPNTMQRALTDLENLKLIYTERTNGKFVTTDIAEINLYREQLATTKVQNFLSEMEKLGFDYKTTINYLKSQKRK